MSERLRLDDPEELRPQAQDPAPQPEPQPQPPPPQPAENGDDENGQEGETEEARTSRTFKERLDRLQREKYEARRDADLYRQQLAEMQRQIQQAQQPQNGQQGDAEQRAYQRLRAEHDEQAFNKACNDLFAKGSEEYGEFRADVDRLNSVGAGNNRAFLQAVSSLPDGHKVYHTLAEDLDEAHRIMQLGQTDPVRMITELARMAVAPAGSAQEGRGQRPVSQAPPPVRPVGGASRNRRMEDMPIADWVRERDRQEVERRKRGER